MSPYERKGDIERKGTETITGDEPVVAGRVAGRMAAASENKVVLI